MRKCLQSTARTVMVFITSSTDHRSGKTGLFLSDFDIMLSKNGGSFSNIDSEVSNFAEVAYGWYKWGLTATHTNTVGDLVMHITATGSDPSDVACEVVEAITLSAIQTECEDALIVYRLDHLIAVADGVAPLQNSHLDRIMNKDASQTYDRSTDSLEAIADSGGGGLTQQQVRDAMKLAPTAGAPDTGSVDKHLDDIIVDTTEVKGDVNTIQGTDLPAVKADTNEIKQDYAKRSTVHPALG